ncbi:MAG: type II toxin-antitoxin system VapC family toxin [Methanobacteriota archaeon]|nr:MAG: type II toxin-antitoxin system VapC family toxin [Euryarchaeota archaeon]
MRVFDSWAWIEFFRGSRAGQAVKDMVEGQDILFTPAICLAEIKAKYLSEAKDPAERLSFIKSRTSIVDIDGAVAEEGADLKIQHGLHTVDALVLASARRAGGELVTGDKHFRGISGVFMLE